MAAGGAGESLPVLSLPGRLHEGGHRAQARPEGVPDLCLVPEPEGEVPEEREHQERSGSSRSQCSPSDLLGRTSHPGGDGPQGEREGREEGEEAVGETTEEAGAERNPC